MTYQWDEETKTARVGVSQTQAADETTSVFAVPIILAYQTSQGRREVKLDISEANQTFYIAVDEKPLMVSFDPGYRCLKTLEFELPREMLTYQLANDEDVIGRITAAQGLAKLEDPKSVEALAGAVKNDGFWGVQAEAAKALGVIKSQAALEALVGCAGVAHPKARRAGGGRPGQLQGEGQPSMPCCPSWSGTTAISWRPRRCGLCARPGKPGHTTL